MQVLIEGLKYSLVMWIIAWIIAIVILIDYHKYGKHRLQRKQGTRE